MTSMYLLLAINFVLADNAAMPAKPSGWLADTWEWFSSLDSFGSRLVVGGLLAVALLTYKFWFVMVPMWVLAGLVVAYLHFSRPKDSL